MVKKQSASKAPTKHASQKDKGKKDDSNASSLAIQKPHFWNMNLLPERGYEMTKATPSFLSTVANLQWDHFVLPRIGYNEEMVREFYAGITESDGPKKTYTSMVRGKTVQFHPKKINEHYMLKYNGFDFEKRVGYSSMKEMEEVRSKIATPNSVWEKFSSNEIKLRSTYLIEALGNWHLFICTSILPTSHTYAMTKERLILLDTILSEGNVDIGRLIAREIYTCITKKKGFLFFPCLITELCMKAAVPIYENEHMKFLSNNLRVDIKERMKKVKEPQPQPKPMPMPKPMPIPRPKPMPAMQEHFMQKQAAVWKFQKEQHDWLQLVFHYMSNELGNIEAPVFPSWVLRTPGQEEEKEEEADKEVEEEEEQQLRKKVTRKQAKGKKKVVIEPEIEEMYDSEEEDEELEKEMDKESEEEEEEETSDEVDSTEEDIARGVILEEIARQKYAKTSESAPQETTQTSPTQSPTKSPISSPTKEPSTPLKSPTIQPQIQSPPHSPPPPSPSKTEQPMLQSPSHITATVISNLEKDIVQDTEEEGHEKEQKSEAVEEPEAEIEAEAMPSDAPASDAPASGASAYQTAATTEHDEATIKLVLEAMARKKKEELGNTHKFFKTPALKKQAVKRKISEAKSTEATASVPASTTEEIDAFASAEKTPTKPSKEKKLKAKHTAPTRQSSRTRSGAKK